MTNNGPLHHKLVFTVVSMHPLWLPRLHFILVQGIHLPSLPHFFMTVIFLQNACHYL